MLSTKSRYATARLFESEKGDPAAPSTAPFPGLRPRSIQPTTGVIEHTVLEGDRLDRLAQNYYNDDRLWWRIVDANPEILHGSDAVGAEMVGRVLLIPAARD